MVTLSADFSADCAFFALGAMIVADNGRGGKMVKAWWNEWWKKSGWRRADWAGMVERLGGKLRAGHGGIPVGHG